ncbi:MAG: DNA-directed RNA polymerase subunit alpha C-terminal domain-containing protein [Gemmatales bacterium]|nr:tetratricopeptide repeat protein [Gemmatales bacterium]MDW8176304.1 DNA-directed RNA polymerase subunit alpha C-terminal domain-containing protein [Gemmatales bacterium]
MMDVLRRDVKSLFLEREECDAGTVQQLRQALTQSTEQYRLLRDTVAAMQQKLAQASGAAAKRWHLKIGIASYFLGRTRDAAEHLRQAEGALASFYLAKALISLEQWDETLKALDRAEKAGYTATQVQLLRAEVYRRQGRLEQAREILGKLRDLSTHSGEYHYQQGMLYLEEGDREKAAEHFERAVELEPHHAAAWFELGFLNDLAGNDDEAIHCLERCIAQPPVHVGALYNLGVLYEDNNQYQRAIECYERLVRAFPTDERPRLFLKDALASREQSMVGQEPRPIPDKLQQVLDTPVTEFELSVRVRNCLERMNIKTLGDLTRVTEEQLLASKNFGETSLKELRAVMESKGLRIGQALEEGARYDPRFREAPPPPQLAFSEQEQALLKKPVSELNFSVRPRKAMAKLGIQTVGDLINYTADQLLEVKNFGVTSLNEVRAKLAELGLKLRGD